VNAVIDNDLLVSGLLWGQRPGRLLRAVVGGKMRLTLKSVEGIAIIDAAEALRRVGLE